MDFFCDDEKVALYKKGSRNEYVSWKISDFYFIILQKVEGGKDKRE